MKNICIIFLSFVILIVTAIGLTGAMPNAQTVTDGGEYLRIHIRADSNEEEAQAVKYRVRDRVVEYLTPLVSQYQTKAAAMEGVEQNLAEVERVAEKALREAGFFYGVRAALTVESFPTRVYGEYVLPAGEYSALILQLGSGEGDNWWCVVYPPLCFSGGANVVYKSKIAEIIRRFYAK